MITSKEAQQKRNLIMSRLHLGGVPQSTIASAFSLTEKRVADILRKPGLVEGIMRTTDKDEKHAPAKRYSAKEAEAAFANLSVRASNRLRAAHVTSIGGFRAWWRSGDTDARLQHRDLLYGHGKIFWQHGKPAPYDVLIKSGEEIARLAIGLGLRKVPPL